MPKLIEGFGPAVGACSLRSLFLVNGGPWQPERRAPNCINREQLPKVAGNLLDATKTITA